MNIIGETQIKTRVIDAASRKVISESPWHKNLIMDNGLNALAKSTNAVNQSGFTAAARIGSGTTPNKYASGAITFTQTGTTVTASAGFFTAGMVGMIFKYGSGSGGAEYYITGFTSTTQVTVDTSATVAVPEVATVWAVNQTALDTLLYSSASYETSAGSCETTFSSNQVTYKRTINFAQQGSPYNVNEIGYFSGTGGTTVFGRIVLSATDVVPITSFYQVVISVTFTFTPAAPTAVANVGTNINTAGNAMLENINNSGVFSQVASNGTAGSGGAMDANVSSTPRFYLITANYSQNGTVGNLVSITGQQVAIGTWAYAGTRGKRTMTFNTTITTSGQTLYGLGICTSSNQAIFDIKLTSTYALPSGSFLPQAVWSLTYNRTLTN